MAVNWSPGPGSGDLPAAAQGTLLEPPPAAGPPPGELPGREHLLGRRIAAALVDVALLTGLLAILGLAVGRVDTGGVAGYGIFLSWAWSGVYLAVLLVYYFALEASIGQTVGKCLLGLRVTRRDGGRPPALVIAWRTLFRLLDWLPVLYLAGFITTLATGRRRQRLGDLFTETAVTRAPPARRRARALAVAALALVVLAVGGLSAYRATAGAQTYRAHGISFAYPAGWQEDDHPSFEVKAGTPLWSTEFGPGAKADLIAVSAYRMNIPVGAGNLAWAGAQVEPQIRRLFEQDSGAMQAGPQEITIGGLPGLRFQGTGTQRDGTPIDSVLLFAFDGTTEYYVDCQHAQAGAGTVQAACSQLIRSFKASAPPPPAAGTQTYQAHGVSFDYPAALQEGTLTGAIGNHSLWAAAFALDRKGFIGIGADRLSAPVTAGRPAVITPAADRAVRRFMRQIPDVMKGGSQQITMGGLPALRFNGATTVKGIPIGVTLVFAFDGRTQYFVLCIHPRASSGELEQACGQVIRTFKVRQATQPGITLAAA